MNAHVPIVAQPALETEGAPRSDWARSARPAALFCLGLWLLSFCLFELPTLLMGGTGLAVMGYQAACAVTGLVLCWGLFLLMWGVRGAGRPQRRLLMAAAGLVALAAHSALDTFVYDGLLDIYEIKAPNSLVDPEVLMFLINGLQLFPVYLLYFAGIALGASMLAIQDRERSLALARAAAQEAQLAALRFQINPHFLFNALNAVTSLVGAARNREAETVVGRLSEFFRASLTTAPGELATLEDEMDIAGAYLDIESARFGPRLVVDIDFDEAVRGALIPHFLLQPLLENAVKYGVACTKRPVCVALRAWREEGELALSVSDDGDPDGSAGPPRGAGVGLGNVAARLEALFGPRARLRTERLSPGFRAEIRLPFGFAGGQEGGSLACAS